MCLSNSSTTVYKCPKSCLRFNSQSRSKTTPPLRPIFEHPLMDWKHPFRLARCNPQLIPVLRPTCPTPDTLIQTWRHLTIRPFVTEHAVANLTDPAQPWPPTPPALGLVHRRPGHTTLPGRERALLIVSSKASPLREHVHAADLPLMPASGIRGEVDATAPTPSMIHKQEPICEWVMRVFIWTLCKQ